MSRDSDVETGYVFYQESHHHRLIATQEGTTYHTFVREAYFVIEFEKVLSDWLSVSSFSRGSSLPKSQSDLQWKGQGRTGLELCHNFAIDGQRNAMNVIPLLQLCRPLQSLKIIILLLKVGCRDQDRLDAFPKCVNYVDKLQETFKCKSVNDDGASLCQSMTMWYVEGGCWCSCPGWSKEALLLPKEDELTDQEYNSLLISHNLRYTQYYIRRQLMPRT